MKSVTKRRIIAAALSTITCGAAIAATASESGGPLSPDKRLTPPPAQPVAGVPPPPQRGTTGVDGKPSPLIATPKLTPTPQTFSTMGDKLTVANAVGLFNCETSITATLKHANGAPAEPADIAFSLGAGMKPIGVARTDASGTAVLPFYLAGNAGVGAGANGITVSYARAGGTRQSATGNFDAVKDRTTLSLVVLDTAGKPITNDKAVVEEDRTIAIQGALRSAETCNAHPEQFGERDVAISLNGKLLARIKTNASGILNHQWMVPKGNLNDYTFTLAFEGDGQLLPSTAPEVVKFQIQHKPKLPPAKITTATIHAVGMY